MKFARVAAIGRSAWPFANFEASEIITISCAPDRLNSIASPTIPFRQPFVEILDDSRHRIKFQKILALLRARRTNGTGRLYFSRANGAATVYRGTSTEHGGQMFRGYVVTRAHDTLHIMGPRYRATNITFETKYKQFAVYTKQRSPASA